MANPEYGYGAFSKERIVPGVVERKQRRKDRENELTDAYAAVDERDKGICWVTGRTTVAGAVMAEQRREHHHLKGRRVRPDWRHKPERIITVCAEAHDLITRGWIVLEGDDARKQLFFHWAEHVDPKQRTLVIKRKTVTGEAA